MSCSRRQFIIYSGALAAVGGVASHTLANTMKIDGVRYGMVHDENLCIGCTACMDACREVNQVPEGVSRLTIIRSEPIGQFPDVKYRFFATPVNIVKVHLVSMFALLVPLLLIKRQGLLMSTLTYVSAANTVLLPALIASGLFTPSIKPRINVISAVKRI